MRKLIKNIFPSNQKKTYFLILIQIGTRYFGKQPLKSFIFIYKNISDNNIY